MANFPLDAYNLRARVAPVLIVLAPLGFAAAALFPDGKKLTGALISTGGTAALVVLFGQIGRDIGKRRQGELFDRWGGSPTTKMLEFRSSSLNAQTLTRYHGKLKRLRPDLRIPMTRADEEADTAGADSAYQSAADYLREATRDKKRFPLVIEENMNFGFRRNLWGMKAAGIVLSLVGLAICIARAAHTYYKSETLDPLALVGTIICAFLLVLWLLRVRERWVRIAAEEYSRELLSACEQLEPLAAPKLAE